MIAAITENHGEKLFFFVNVGEKTVWARWVDKMHGPALLAAQAIQQKVFAEQIGESLLGASCLPKPKKIRIPRARPGRQA